MKNCLEKKKMKNNNTATTKNNIIKTKKIIILLSSLPMHTYNYITIQDIFYNHWIIIDLLNLNIVYSQITTNHTYTFK